MLDPIDCVDDLVHANLLHALGVHRLSTLLRNLSTRRMRLISNEGYPVFSVILRWSSRQSLRPRILLTDISASSTRGNERALPDSQVNGDMAHSVGTVDANFDLECRFISSLKRSMIDGLCMRSGLRSTELQPEQGIAPRSIYRSWQHEKQIPEMKKLSNVRDERDDAREAIWGITA